MSLGLATEWIEMSTQYGSADRSPGLGLATEWIEILSGLNFLISLAGLGLATEWIEIYQDRDARIHIQSRSCDRVD